MNKLLTNPLTGITNDINSIKNILDNAISTPYIGTFEATDLKTQNVSSVDRSIEALQLAGDDAVYKSIPTTQVLLGDLNLPSSIGNVNIGAELGLVITQANGNTASLLTKVSKTETATQNMNGSLKITSTTPSLELKNTTASPNSGTIRFTDQLDNPKATIKLKSDGGIEVLNNTDILFRIIPPTLNTNIFTNFSVNNYTQPDTNIYMTADNGALNNYYETATTRYVHQVVDATKSFGLGNDVKGTIYQYDYNNDRFNFEKKVLSNQTLPLEFTNPNEFISKTYADTKLSKTEPATQVLTGDIQIPMGETSALIGQNLYDLNSTSNELLNKTINIDNSTFENYTKINGNLDIDIVGIYGLIPAAASDYFAYGICSASSVLTPNYAYLAFDQINGTQWVSKGGYPSGTGSYNGSTTTIVDGVPQLGEWVQIAFNGILETNKVAIEGHTKPPVSWVLAGSLDNQTWFTLRDETNYPITPTLVDFTYTPTRTKYVRLIARSTMVVNYPSMTIDFINIYGKLVVEISDGKISGEINAGKVNSDYIKTSEIASNLITTTSLLAPNVINKSRFSFTRNTANSSLYLDENIKIRWDGNRDLWVNKISATDIYYATKVVSLGGTLGNGDIVLLNTGQILFYRNSLTGFVSFIISSPSSDLPIYKIHFQLDTAVVTEYIHCIVEKC